METEKEILERITDEQINLFKRKEARQVLFDEAVMKLMVRKDEDIHKIGIILESILGELRALRATM